MMPVLMIAICPCSVKGTLGETLYVYCNIPVQVTLLAYSVRTALKKKKP